MINQDILILNNPIESKINISSLEKILSTDKNIGTIKMEVLRNEYPKNNFLQKVKTKARSYPKTNIIETINTLNSFCLNTRAIHGIATNCNSDRIILSISMKDEYNDYDKLKQMYESGNLI